MLSIVEALRKTDFFGDLDEVLLSRLAQVAVERKLKRDETLFLAGEPAQGLYVIASGSVRAYRTSAEGREQVIHTEQASKVVCQKPAGVRFLAGSYFFGCTADNQFAAIMAAFGSKIDDVVGRLNDVEIVFDDNH
jgi:hypothetical protein